VPLRSVEAASRDAAITAAKEQFGTTARVVGVRKVRSGGVLGFFATERYVAEVEATTGERPAVPPAAQPRATSDIPLEERARAAAASIARLAAAEAKGDPVDELAGLLGGLAPAADDAPVYTRASFQRAVAADTSHEAAAKSATFSAFSPAPAAATRGAGRVRPAAPCADPRARTLASRSGTAHPWYGRRGSRCHPAAAGDRAGGSEPGVAHPKRPAPALRPAAANRRGAWLPVARSPPARRRLPR